MYIEKHDINGETYVKLDELNDLMKAERRKCMKEAKLANMAGESDKKMRFVYEHGALIDLGRKVNMSEDGECYVIFTRDKYGNWEFLIDVIEWGKLPEYMQKAAAKAKDGWVTFVTSEIDEATLYDSFDKAEAELRRVFEKTGCEDWHMTKKWMFDTKENRESLLALFYDGGEESGAIRSRPKQSGKSEKPKRKVRCPGRYTVWYRDDGDTTLHCMGFVRFEKGIPVFTNRPCKATRFVWRGMAENVAEKCGAGFEVVDMIGQMTAEERLLRAIFREDGMDGDVEPEYHGDGTRAEDEDWDGDD